MTGLRGLRSMDDRLLKMYLEYASSDEAFAVLFVKEHLAQAEGHWVDISDYHRYEMSSNNMHFRFVVGNLYRRTINAQYPPKSAYTVEGKFNEREYYLMARAITWETAHRDIEQQKSKGVGRQKFKITGVSYDKNRDNKQFFRDDAPPEIKALALNLLDRTNPLWNKALKYAVVPEYVYEVRSIKVG